MTAAAVGFSTIAAVFIYAYDDISKTFGDRQDPLFEAGARIRMILNKTSSCVWISRSSK